MKLEYDGDDLIRVVVIFCPWCNMFFSKTGTEIGTERLVSHEFTALSALCPVLPRVDDLFRHSKIAF